MVTEQLTTERRPIVEGSEVESLWKLYDGVFAPINEDTPCRQSLHKADFTSLLKTERMEKIVVRDDTLQPVGLAVCVRMTTEETLLPWINPGYFLKHWPKYWGKIIYCPIICVIRGKRGLGIGAALMLEIQKFMQERGVLVVGFDHSVGHLPDLSGMIGFVTGGEKLGDMSDGALDHQTYHLMLDTRSPHLNRGNL